MHVVRCPAVENASSPNDLGYKKNVNGYSRSFSTHAMHRMRERRISNADIKFATKNIATMTPISEGRWRLTAKNGMVVIGIVDDVEKTFVILTSYWPDKTT